MKCIDSEGNRVGLGPYHNQTQWQAALQEAEKHGRLMTWGNVGNAVMLAVVGAVIVVAAVLIGGTP